MTSSKFRTVKLLRYVNAFDYFVLCSEFLFVLFIIYYTIEEGLEVNPILIFIPSLHSIFQIAAMKGEYFKSVMNCLDLIVIVLSYISMSFNIYRQVQVNNLLDQLLTDDSTDHDDFSFLCYWQYQFNNILSATIFLAWIKVGNEDDVTMNRRDLSCLDL